MGTKFREWNEFCRTAELSAPLFCILTLEIWRTQILCHSFDLNAFYMIQQYFSQFFKFAQIKKNGGLISWGEPILQNGWTILSSFFLYDFRNLKDPNSFLFLGFNAFFMIQQLLPQFFEDSSSSNFLSVLKIP